VSKGSFEIRQPVNSAEWAEVRKLCCLTGNGGEPIDPARWPFFGEQWVGPYQKLRPQWTYLALSEGKYAGYLTGCPDTRNFKLARALRFVPGLLLRVGLGRFERNEKTRGDLQRFIRRSLGFQKSPEDSFPSELLDTLLRDYPAHLHVNVAREFRGTGAGNELIRKFREGLQSKGIAGIHLFCGEAPVKFYQRQGFTELGRIEFKPGVWIFALGLRW
jgi:GNAT superfamily N-acetyltransferase